MLKNILFLVLSLVLLAGCAPGENKVPASQAVPVVDSKIKAGWELAWENTMSAARKEGRIVVYGTVGGDPQRALVEGFNKKFNIEVEWITGSGGLLNARLMAERRAGVYFPDVFLGGATTPVTQLKPAGVLEPLDPVLILPEVKDPKAWWSGELLFIDPEHYIFSFIAAPYPSLGINTNLVKPGEVKSNRDLLDPKWKRKIMLSDPTVLGAAHKWFMVEAQPQRMGLDYMRELAKQEPFVIKDDRLQIEWLAQGKYPILIAGKTDPYVEFKKAGAPLDRITPEEGTFLMSASGNITLVKNAPHPNAARTFINWLLSREGQTVLARVYTFPSARLDVTTEFVDPLNMRYPGVKYFWSDTEEFLVSGTKWANTAKEIFGHLVK